MATFIIKPKRRRADDPRAEPTSATLRDALATLPDGSVQIVSGMSANAFSSAASPPARNAASIVVRADQRVVERLRTEHAQDIFVEPIIEFRKTAPFDLLRAAPLDLSTTLSEDPLVSEFAGAERRLRVKVSGRSAGRLLAAGFTEVYVFLLASSGDRAHLRGRTDANGEVDFHFARFYEVISVIAAPYTEYWPTIVRGDPGSTLLHIKCQSLPDDGPAGWWHSAVGSAAQMRHGVRDASEPIRVGVIDSGCGPHPALRHVIDHGAFIDGEWLDDGADSGAHGTHVCGLIGARGQGARIPFWGIAPGVELHSVRVFPPGGGANQGDISDALDHLVGSGVDLVNMSLGADRSSAILHDAIVAAYEAGVVCVCAAGNNSGPVAYPANFAETIAVSAVGKLGSVPPTSLQALPNNPALYGPNGFFAADFTNFGDAIRIAAPGVGVIAPVPARFGFGQPFSAMNGTSMASPIAAGTLAALLARSVDYASMKPSRERSRFVRALLGANARPLGLPAPYEGRGMPYLGGRLLT